MSNDQGCEEYPDIFRKTPAGATQRERDQIKEENRQHGRIYLALRYILKHDFGFKAAVPEKPEDFPSELEDKDRAHFVAIYGTLLADGWTDPSLGKTVPTGDDLMIPHHQDPILVTRRFADDAVAAVKEFTSRAQLYTKVFGFLRLEGSSQSSNPRPVAREEAAR